MPKVFVPNLVTRYNPQKGKVVPCFDFTNATRFGELHFVLNDDYKSEFFHDAIQKVEKSLENVTKEDYFIPTGEPAMIAVCAAVIVKKTGKLNLLRWDRIRQEYYLTSAEI